MIRFYDIEQDIEREATQADWDALHQRATSSLAQLERHRALVRDLRLCLAGALPIATAAQPVTPRGLRHLLEKHGV